MPLQKPIQLSNGSELPAQVAKDAYEAHRFYHGTTARGAESIRKNGFKNDLKTSSLKHFPSEWNLTQEEEQELRNSHYLTQNKAKAATFAKLRVDTENYSSNTYGNNHPKIVRALLDNEKISGLERDSEIQFRSTKDIPNSNVLGSKGAASENDSKVLRQALRERGYQLSKADAAIVLAQTQSDSEDDNVE